MRAVVQRVTQASVRVGGRLTGEIGPGLLILVCAMQGDSDAQAEQLAARIAKLRIFRDDAGKMNLSLRDTGGAALIVSQFTLAADLRGNRPGFSTAAAPDVGRRLYEYFTDRMRAEGIATERQPLGPLAGKQEGLPQAPCGLATAIAPALRCACSTPPPGAGLGCAGMRGPCGTLVTNRAGKRAAFPGPPARHPISGGSG